MVEREKRTPTTASLGRKWDIRDLTAAILQGSSLEEMAKFLADAPPKTRCGRRRWS
jgi:hypothetical protein